MTVQAGCKIRQQIIIFIEKRISFPASFKMLRILDLSVGYAMLFSRRWMLCCRQRNARTAYLNCMKLAEPKGSNRASEARFCCLRHRPDETVNGRKPAYWYRYGRNDKIQRDAFVNASPWIHYFGYYHHIIVRLAMLSGAL